MKTTIQITGLAHGGFGVGRKEGLVYFIEQGLPGDVVEIGITKTEKRVVWAKIATLLEPSPDRIQPECSCLGRCGGCDWLQFQYPAQGKWKRRIVSDCLKRIGGIESVPSWVEDDSLRFGYRTRAEFHCDENGWGFYARGSHRVTPIARCPLCHPKMNDALERLSGMEASGSLEITVNPDGNDVLVWMSRPNASVSAAFESVNWPNDGKPRAQFVFDGIPIVNGTFSQSSLLLNRMLVQAVHQFVGKLGTVPSESRRDATGLSLIFGEAGRVLDLYCGSGNFSLTLPDAVTVLGIDHNREGIRAASACHRGRYLTGTERDFEKALSSGPWDAVILDPPRTGAKAIMSTLARVKGECIVYVSCNPATLARDAKFLIRAGWQLEELIAVDMFPYTSHIETVCRFKRVS